MKPVIPLLWLLTATAITAGTDEAKPVRVMSWNLHHGAGMDRRIDLSRIAAVIDKEKPDLVILQEVDDQTDRSAKVNQTAELAKLTGMTGCFGRAMKFGGGGYGQAILSKHPVISTKVHPLPSSDEPRIAFEATVSIRGVEMKIISTHFDLTADKRLEQAVFLTNICKNCPLPIILGGDFNATPGSPSIAFLEKNWTASPKTAAKPAGEIDYFFIKGYTHSSPVQVLSESMASDHRPLLGDFSRK
jgi:endonuclease/exonuclease/phosphatase family metal-dependent hydrolase